MEERSYTASYLASLPVSRMVYPDRFLDKLKYYIFRFYSPMHPFWRDLLLNIRVIYHDGRQDYLLGKLRPDKTIDELVEYLTKNDFGNHFIAWQDEGEIASLRLVKNFKYQYHLRIFQDGEIRGHYEYTPECHPIAHLKEKDMTDGKEIFETVLFDWVEREI